ncbi:MAG: ABC transporter ATP-binding protein [Candidatus Bathyarchaeota archaeon]|nr:ABC transporter ATP-binding protein [Candidatus Bathyarchaeota archaeon]MCX8177774.1 ABC transporter ATP-binding protein [Candidatus Bathyarchaeota archaeon]MDW8194054.1 ABC transporter ATP-binding protein [Nitrososphaerota archaeon]
MEETAVIVEGLTVKYGSFVAVDNLSFAVNTGEIYGLLGPNGAGKTSTIKAIVGVLPPYSGKIQVYGKSLLEDEVAVKSMIGYVPEEVVLFDSLTPREFLEFIASVRGLKADIVSSRLEKLVDAFDIKKYFDTPIAALSMGNKQKVAVIAALIHEPKLLILDEPLVGLDARSSKILKELISYHAKRGGAVIFSTHIMEVAEKLCTKVGIINHGKLVGEGTVDELRRLVKSAEGSLEDIFLKVTEQETSLNEVIRALEEE